MQSWRKTNQFFFSLRGKRPDCHIPILCKNYNFLKNAIFEEENSFFFYCGGDSMACTCDFLSPPGPPPPRCAPLTLRWLWFSPSRCSCAPTSRLGSEWSPRGEWLGQRRPRRAPPALVWWRRWTLWSSGSELVTSRWRATQDCCHRSTNLRGFAERHWVQWVVALHRDVSGELE